MHRLKAVPLKYAYDSFFVENIEAFRAMDHDLSSAYQNGVSKLDAVSNIDYTPILVKTQNPGVIITLAKVIAYFRQITNQAKNIPMDAVIRSMGNPMNNSMNLTHTQIMAMLDEFTKNLNAGLKASAYHYEVNFIQKGQLGDLLLSISLPMGDKTQAFSFSLMNGPLSSTFDEALKWKAIIGSGAQIKDRPIAGKARYRDLYREIRDPLCKGKDANHIAVSQDDRPFYLYDMVASAKVPTSAAQWKEEKWQKTIQTSTTFNSLLLTSDGTLFGLENNGFFVEDAERGVWVKRLALPAESNNLMRAEQISSGVVYMMDRKADVFFWDGKLWKQEANPQWYSPPNRENDIVSFSVSSSTHSFFFNWLTNTYHPSGNRMEPARASVKGSSLSVSDTIEVVELDQLLFAIQEDKKLYKSDTTAISWAEVGGNAPEGFIHLRHLTDGSLILMGESGAIYEYQSGANTYLLLAKSPKMNGAIKDFTINESRKICYLSDHNEIFCN